jgi:hypothetical protein
VGLDAYLVLESKLLAETVIAALPHRLLFPATGIESMDRNRSEKHVCSANDSDVHGLPYCSTTVLLWSFGMLKLWIVAE